MAKCLSIGQNSQGLSLYTLGGVEGTLTLSHQQPAVQGGENLAAP